MIEWPTQPDGLFCSQNNQSSRLVASPLFHSVAPSLVVLPEPLVSYWDPRIVKAILLVMSNEIKIEHRVRIALGETFPTEKSIRDKFLKNRFRGYLFFNFFPSIRRTVCFLYIFSSPQTFISLLHLHSI